MDIRRSFSMSYSKFALLYVRSSLAIQKSKRAIFSNWYKVFAFASTWRKVVGVISITPSIFLKPIDGADELCEAVTDAQCAGIICTKANGGVAIFQTSANTAPIYSQASLYAIVAFGSAARIAEKSVEIAREQGIKVGLFRPITLFPFPTKQIAELSKKVKGILVAEINAGQMVQDVRLAVNGAVPVEQFGRLGGIVPDPEEIVNALKKVM